VPRAADIIAELDRLGQTVCTVESLTGGLVCAELTSVPGASRVVLGGVVSYTDAVKRDVVGVPEAVLLSHGAVSGQCAAAMAEQARIRFGATWAVSTTGVAGPSTQEGKDVGTVFLAVDGPRCRTVPLHLSGDRPEIRARACHEALELFEGCLRGC
jgi:nicotinamide-nucleotide amidase